jgi:hypothetical protein
MTDIVERLRDMHNHEDTALRIEAADEIARLRAALGELLSGHDNLYIAHFGPDSNPHDDIAAKPARRALEPKP